jgi:hypothetical protein
MEGAMMDGASRLGRGLAGLLGNLEEVRQEQITAMAISFRDAIIFQDRPARRRVPTSRPPDGLRTAAEAAAKLRCSIKTLNGHVAAGRLKYVHVGHGTKRQRRMYADSDLDEFIANQTRKDVPACPSSARSARRTGITTSNGEVIGFTARRSARLAAKLKK